MEHSKSPQVRQGNKTITYYEMTVAAMKSKLISIGVAES